MYLEVFRWLRNTGVQVPNPNQLVTRIMLTPDRESVRFLCLCSLGGGRALKRGHPKINQGLLIQDTTPISRSSTRAWGSTSLRGLGFIPPRHGMRLRTRVFASAPKCIKLPFANTPLKHPVTHLKQKKRGQPTMCVSKWEIESSNLGPTKQRSKKLGIAALAEDQSVVLIE